MEYPTSQLALYPKKAIEVWQLYRILLEQNFYLNAQKLWKLTTAVLSNKHSPILKRISIIMNSISQTAQA